MRLVGRVATTFQIAVRGLVESRVPFLSERAIRSRQTRNLRRIVDHAFRYVPYYREVSQAQGISSGDLQTCEDLDRLPILDGRTLQADPIRFVSQAYALHELVKVHSTGTAAYGSKIVYWDPRVIMTETAFGERDRSVLRGLLGNPRRLVRVSFFHPDSSTAATTRFRAARLVIPAPVMRTHTLSTELPYSEIDRRINQIRPDVVYSYGSFAEAYLGHVLESGFDVRLPRVWVFGGDSVTPEGRRRIEAGLPCLLYSTYQAVESGRIGFECERRAGFHINTDLCHVRLVNEQGETVPVGATGEVVLSNLYNPGTILLNYRLGDLASWSTEPCPCGRTLPLLHLTGARASGSLRLLNGRTLQEPALLHACKERMHDVLQFQIIEFAPESILWKVILTKTADEARIRADLVACSRSVMSPAADVRVEIVDRIVVPQGAKLTHIVRTSSSA